MRYLSGGEESEAATFIAESAKIASGSACSRALCGSLIVKNNEIIGTGFNGPPQRMEEQRRCSNSKDGYHKKVTDKTCCVHAEQRAIMDALKKSPDKIAGSRLYFIRLDESGIPSRAGKPYCKICSKMALDAGISEFVLWHDDGICVYDTGEYNTLSFRFDGQ